MTEFKREFFKNDAVFGKLFELIKKNHKVANHTEKVLIENRHIKDFCEEARHFVEMPGNKPLYIHYDTASWFKEPMGVQVKIESIGVYDDFLEYNTARMKGLHGSDTADIPTSNLN
jgi:hypothetical protein